MAAQKYSETPLCFFVVSGGAIDGEICLSLAECAWLLVIIMTYPSLKPKANRRLMNESRYRCGMLIEGYYLHIDVLI